MPRYLDDYGVPITYNEWLVAAPRAVIQIVHGIGEHAGRYTELAGVLNAAGYSVVADDHRGHGATGIDQYGGDTSRLGHLGVGGLRATEKAIRRLGTLIRIAHPGVPVVYLGHSWGSLMGQRLLNAHPEDYDAVVFTGSAYRMPGFLEAGPLNKRYAHLGDTGFEWLSRDPEVHHAFVADPLTFEANILRLFGLRDALRLFGRPRRALAANPPLLLMAGDDDPVGGEKSVERLAHEYVRRSGLTEVTAIIYEGARHEIFNETNRDEVYADLVEWLNLNLPIYEATLRKCTSPQTSVSHSEPSPRG
ncbi:alpha/beta hydrolase [Klugiella xanthotipulae]|uniref:Alpha-beta hydrolase superfamily lysophospholipase n=1 Tax=Klugiella xanthotipulae TaxID=244735 RepID=A0A543I6U0_9MICO|nr:alpha/beta hydrolase [Klugiella xanthotipulae]TQM66210.1 alpha-beta hydrolase superfamily lysophospholipase [Klugiella xanthotipulae]